MIITYLPVPWAAPFMPLLRNPQVPAPPRSRGGFGGSLLPAVCSVLGLAGGVPEQSLGPHSWCWELRGPGPILTDLMVLGLLSVGS